MLVVTPAQGRSDDHQPDDKEDESPHVLTRPHWSAHIGPYALPASARDPAPGVDRKEVVEQRQEYYHANREGHRPDPPFAKQHMLEQHEKDDRGQQASDTRHPHRLPSSERPCQTLCNGTYERPPGGVNRSRTRTTPLRRTRRRGDGAGSTRPSPP